MNETWKPIPGYEGLYEASSLGRIRSAPGKITSNARYSKRVWKTRILKTKQPRNAKRHDKRVSLWKDGVQKDHLVSRLVAAAFLGSPREPLTVNHKNGDYLDNRPENLEWVTMAENNKHAFESGLCDAFVNPVVLMRSDGEEIRFRSLSKASQFLKRSNGYIFGVYKRGANTASGADGTEYTFEVLNNGSKRLRTIYPY